ncbi:MAG TPA: TolC family protein [Myxococcales bacterium]|nr:TolC family protein [Myxococcales bacterium]
MLHLLVLGATLAQTAAAGVAGLPEPPRLPSPLTLEQAEEIFLAHGLDMLVAEANARGAEGDLTAAGAHPNPGLNVGVNYGPAVSGDILSSNLGTDKPNVTWGLGFGLTDNASIEDALSGKHALRIEAAAKALAAVRQSVADLRRNEVSQVRQAFVAILLANDNLAFALDVQKSYQQSYELNQTRYKKGDINEADLAKISVAKLEADQAVTQAREGTEVARDALAFLLGARGEIPSFEVAGDLDFRILPALEGKSEPDLLALGLAHRPDVKAATAAREQQEALVAQARRLVFPDVSLQLGYSEQCNSSTCSSVPTFDVGLSGNLPVLYQQQGEIRRAESNLVAAQAMEEKARAQVLSDVGQAWASYRAARELVERMEHAELAQAKLSRDLEELMYRKGAASLLDYLDAERTYIAANLEYHQDLSSYWNAVFQLEQATALPLR